MDVTATPVPHTDRTYLLTALGYGILGLLLGIHMAASHNHSQLVTHAHIMLVGFLLSFVYALCFRLWLVGAHGWVRRVQVVSYQISAPVLMLCLFLLYGNFVEAESLDPLLALSSIGVLISLICLKVLVLRHVKKSG